MIFLFPKKYNKPNFWDEPLCNFDDTKSTIFININNNLLFF